MAELLLIRGSNPNFRAAETGVTPLIIAALEDNRPMAQLLLQHGAEPTLAMPDGMTALSVMPQLIEDIPEPRQAEIIELVQDANTEEDPRSESQS
jgi:ankyrin repeat protein